MNSKIDKLATDMEDILNKIVIEQKKISLDETKNNFILIEKEIKKFIKKFDFYSSSKVTNRLISELRIIQNEFKALYDNFDDKLMLFIVGNGNVGKSTLVNSLVGEEVAKTNFLPTTWKIDVYYPNKDDVAIIRYNNGNIKRTTSMDARNIVELEEHKTKIAKKKYNEAKNKALSSLTDEKEIKEMKLKLGREYLYNSNIVEVRWPVKENWILEQCYIVDTPGLNQDLLENNQFGSIQDYYHNADGVIWILDANSVAGKSSDDQVKKLQETLKGVGGVRDNIICAVNRIDAVRKNSGQDGEKVVLKDVEKFFGNVFSYILAISAKQAFNGIKSDDEETIKESNIYALQREIKNIFIEKADEIKNSSKENGIIALQKKIKKLTSDYLYEINDKKCTIIKKQNNYKEKSNLSKEKIKNEIESMFSNYLFLVNKRIDTHIDSLSEGKGKDFIKNTIYDISSLKSEIDSVSVIIQNDLKRQVNLWHDDAYISEYKYINHVIEVSKININYDKTIDLKGINDIQIFTPSQEDSLFSLLGNMWGKFVFWMNKSKIRNSLYSTIKDQCTKLENEMEEYFYNMIDKQIEYCNDKLLKSYSDLLVPYSKINSVTSDVSNFTQDIMIKEKEVTLEDVFRRSE